MSTVGPIEVGEIKRVKFDFSTEAAAGVTLSLPDVDCVIWEGADATPASVLVGLPSVSGMFVEQVVQPGVVGCTYKLSAVATDSSGLRHKMSTLLKVVPG